MSKLFPHLFQPLALRHKTLKNRIVFGAHTANMAEDGLPGARHLGYYEERARGGAAMIVVEPVPAHRTGVLTRGNFRHEDDTVIPAFRPITEACRTHGAVMIQQIYHVGQHGDFDNSFQPNWSPSGLPSYHDSDGSHAMSEAEIEEVIEGFAQAARRVARRRASTGSSSSPPTTGADRAVLDTLVEPPRRQVGRLASRTGHALLDLEVVRAHPRAGSVRDDFIIGMAVSLRSRDVEVSLSVEALQEIVAYLRPARA